MNEDTELLALASALEDEGMEWIAALNLARELLPTLARAAYAWDAAAFADGNTIALNPTSN